MSELLVSWEAQRLADARFFGIHGARKMGYIKGIKKKGVWYYDRAEVEQLVADFDELPPLEAQEWRCDHFDIWPCWWDLDRAPQCGKSKRDGSRYCGLHRRDDEWEVQTRCNDHFIKIARTHK